MPLARITFLSCLLSLLVTAPSTILAETYKWEDSKGIHYSDNAASVPEKYRDKALDEPVVERKLNAPQPNAGAYQQSSIYNQINQQANYQSSIDQQRRVAEAINQQNANYQAAIEKQKRAAEVMRQQQAKALAKSTKDAETAMQSLAKFMAVWVLIGLAVFISWIGTIVDIVRSEFTSPSNKTVWMILVVLLPLLGMFLYYVFGTSQKSNSSSYKNKEQAELLARLKPRDTGGENFKF